MATWRLGLLVLGWGNCPEESGPWRLSVCVRVGGETGQTTERHIETGEGGGREGQTDKGAHTRSQMVSDNNL